MARYVVADSEAQPGAGWGHLFEDGSRSVERDCRFVFDTDEQKLIHLDIRSRSSWRGSSRYELLDLEDSLVNANRDALVNPEGWGLLSMEELPDWAQKEETPEPG